MCLVISERRHLYSKESLSCPEFKPLIAQTPLTVYKVLKFNSDGLQTPFKKKDINFISGNAVLEAPMMDHYKDGWCVDIGIHAFQTKTDARAYLEFWSYFDLTLNSAIYEAVIPVGTRYFYGTNGTIVSEKLIIKNKIVK